MRFSRIGMRRGLFPHHTRRLRANSDVPAAMDDRYHERIGAQRLPVAGCQRESLSLQRPECGQPKGFEFQLLQPASHHH